LKQNAGQCADVTGERLTEFFFRAEERGNKILKEVKKGTSFFKNVQFFS
jgi:hypothetical protein